MWLPANVVNRLRAMRGPDESYSDVILRVVDVAVWPGSSSRSAFASNKSSVSKPSVNQP